MSLMRHADALAAENDRQAATTSLREAHRITTGLGERPLRTEVEARAQRSRTSLDDSAEEPTDAFDVHGITAREHQVLRLRTAAS